MADKLRVTIVTPAGQKMDREVDELNAPGFDGEFGVLPEHREVLTRNRPGIMVAKTDGKDEIWAVGAGFIEVGPNSVTLIVQSAERAVDIDTERAKRSLQRAEKEIEALEYNQLDPEFAQCQLRVERAEARIEAAGKTH